MPSAQTGSAQETLTVTATVVTSVGIVIGPDGEQRMIIANAADPADNVSRLQPVVMAKLTPDAKEKGKASTAKKKKFAE